MSNRGVKLTSTRFKGLLAKVIICGSLGFTVACQQADNQSSNNDSQDLVVQSANRKDKENIAVIPPRTPGEITVNQPSPFPSPASTANPQVNSSDDTNSVVTAPQDRASRTESDNSISKALTEKLSPKITPKPNIPEAQNQTETRTQPNQAKPVVEALRSAAKNPARKIAAASNTNVYRSRRLGVNFKYPKGFVIKEPQKTPGTSKVLELWSLKDYRAIESGKYKNTFSPGNISISLEDNPQNLSLVQWVTNNDELGDIIPES